MLAVGWRLRRSNGWQASGCLVSAVARPLRGADRARPGRTDGRASRLPRQLRAVSRRRRRASAGSATVPGALVAARCGRRAAGASGARAAVVRRADRSCERGLVQTRCRSGANPSIWRRIIIARGCCSARRCRMPAAATRRSSNSRPPSGSGQPIRSATCSSASAWRRSAAWREARQQFLDAIEIDPAQCARPAAPSTVLDQMEAQIQQR